MRYLPMITKLVAVALVFSFIPTNQTEAFEQLPRSLRWNLMSQSGKIQYNAEGYSYGVHYVEPGEMVQMRMTVRNHSNNPRAQMWYGASALLDEGPQYPNAHAIGLGTWDPMDHIPSFLDSSSFIINGNRLFYYDGMSINRNEYVTFYWNVKVANGVQPGIYNLVLSLVREFDEWGYRVTPSGANHKYRGALWKFVVGEVPLVDDAPKIVTSRSAQIDGHTQETDFSLFNRDGDLLSTFSVPSDLIKGIANNVQVFGKKIYYLSGSRALTSIGEIDSNTHNSRVLGFTQSTNTSSSLSGIIDWSVTNDNSRIAWMDTLGIIRVANINGSNIRVYDTGLDPQINDVNFAGDSVYFNTSVFADQIREIDLNANMIIDIANKEPNTPFDVSASNQYLAYVTSPGDTDLQLTVKNVATSQTCSLPIPFGIIYGPWFSADESRVLVTGRDYPGDVDTTIVAYTNSCQLISTLSEYNVVGFLSTTKLLAQISGGLYSIGLYGRDENRSFIANQFFRGVLAD